MTDGGLRLTIREMKRCEWEMLCESLPREGSELEEALRHLSWGEGWLRKDGSPTETGARYLRQVWGALVGGPLQAGEFRVERVGRWGVQFVIDAGYAAERAPRRRPCQDQTQWERGWQSGNAGSSDISPYKSGSVEAQRWYSGFVAGRTRRSRRSNTARAARLEHRSKAEQWDAVFEREIDRRFCAHV
jgi:hypothetical protein